MNVHTFGNSITFGYGASNPAHAYPSLLAARYGATLVNHAVSGGCSAEGAGIVQGVSPAAGDLVTYDYGINDSQRYFTAPLQEFFKGFALEAVVQLTCPNRIPMSVNSGGSWVINPALTTTGSWTPRQPDSRIPWSKGVWSNTANSTITATVSGHAVYVSGAATDWPGGLASVFGPLAAEVWIDGTKAGDITSDWQGMATVGTPSQSSAPFALRFAPGSGSHTVTVKMLSGFLYLEKITGSDQPAGPTLILCTPTRTFQPGDTHAPGPVIAMGAIEAQMAADLTADGRDVRLADIYPLCGPTDVNGDFIHWNDAMHAKADVCIAGANGAVIPPPPPATGDAKTYWRGTSYFISHLDGTNEQQIYP